MNTLGFGTIHQASDGYYTFVVTAKQDILTLINIFNGRLVLNKTNHRFLSQWLNHYNTINPSNTVTYLGPSTFVGLNNAWLCGFTDADGSFGFKLSRDTSRKDGIRLRTYWYVDQSYEKDFFDLMKKVLGWGRIEKRNPKTGFNPNPSDAWRFITDSNTNCSTMVEYYDKYTPRTTKLFVRYIRMKRVLGWIAADGGWRTHLNAIRRLIELNQRLS